MDREELAQKILFLTGQNRRQEQAIITLSKCIDVLEVNREVIQREDLIKSILTNGKEVKNGNKD